MNQLITMDVSILTEHPKWQTAEGRVLMRPPLSFDGRRVFPWIQEGLAQEDTEAEAALERIAALLLQRQTGPLMFRLACHFSTVSAFFGSAPDALQAGRSCTPLNSSQGFNNYAPRKCGNPGGHFRNSPCRSPRLQQRQTSQFGEHSREMRSDHS